MATKKVNIDIIAKDKSKKALQGVNNNLDKVKKKANLIKSALIGIGGALVLQKIVSVTARFEDLRDSLTAVTGSAEDGKQAFDFIKDFATETQFSVEDLTKSFIMLKASGIDPTRKLLTTFTDTAAVTTDQIGVLDAMTRVFARGIQGGLGLEELNQIADRGVPVFRILEEQLGITRLEIAKFGQSTEGAAKILEALQVGLNAEFGGATATKMDNLSTAMSNFGIAVDNSADAFGQGGFGGALTNAINQMTRFITFIEPLISLLGKLTGLVITVLVTPFQLLGDAVAYATQKGSEFLQWLGITEKLADEVSTATDSQTESNKKLAESIEVVEMKTIDLISASKKQIEANNKIFQSIRDRNKSEFDLIGEKMEKELALVEEQENLLKLIRDDAIAQGLQSEELANANYLKGLEEFEDMKNMIILEAKDERMKIIEDELEEAFKLQQSYYDKNLQALKSRNFDFENLEKMSDEQKKDLAKASGRELLGELAKNNKAAFELNKAFKIKDAIIDGIAGVQKALAMGPFGIPLAIMIGGLTAANVAQIAQTNYTGRQLGGRVRKGEPYIVGESGREMFVPNQDGNIVPNHDMKQGVNVNFNINTVDARGFNELLVNSRGVIVNMINSAVNEKGRQAII